MDPTLVISPQAHWQLIRVVVNNPDDEGWSLALGLWDGNPCFGKRWDGDGPDNKGHPISSGYPVWFVEPDHGYYDWVISHSGWLSDTDQAFAREFLSRRA